MVKMNEKALTLCIWEKSPSVLLSERRKVQKDVYRMQFLFVIKEEGVIGFGCRPHVGREFDMLGLQGRADGIH